MPHLYFARRRWTIAIFFCCLFATQSIWAQINNTPFEQVFSFANIDKESLKKDFPHLYQVVKTKDYTTENVNAFIKSHETEWTAFCNLPAVKKLNIAWPTMGITAVAAKQEFTHSMYQWYKAANVADATRKELFPHFPLPNLKNEATKELDEYETRVSTWQRLYPEEYEHFINAPQLTALNPYYKGYFKLPYLPRFVGSQIELEKPIKANTGKPVTDEYQYQLRLRNWYFVFKPEEFEKQYGKDYKFPESFDAAQYRAQIIKMLKDKKAGTYPDYSNAH